MPSPPAPQRCQCKTTLLQLSQGEMCVTKKKERVSELLLGLGHLAAGGGGQSLSFQTSGLPVGQDISLSTYIFKQPGQGFHL